MHGSCAPCAAADTPRPAGGPPARLLTSPSAAGLVCRTAIACGRSPQRSNLVVILALPLWRRPQPEFASELCNLVAYCQRGGPLPQPLLQGEGERRARQLGHAASSLLAWSLCRLACQADRQATCLHSRQGAARLKGLPSHLQRAATAPPTWAMSFASHWASSSRKLQWPRGAAGSSAGRLQRPGEGRSRHAHVWAAQRQVAGSGGGAQSVTPWHGDRRSSNQLAANQVRSPPGCPTTSTGCQGCMRRQLARQGARWEWRLCQAGAPECLCQKRAHPRDGLPLGQDLVLQPALLLILLGECCLRLRRSRASRCCRGGAGRRRALPTIGSGCIAAAG